MNTLRRIANFYRVQVAVLWEWRPGWRALLVRAIVSLVTGTIALTLTVLLMPGIKADSLWTILVAVILLAAFNLLFRPIVLAAFVSISTIAVIVATLVLQILSFLFVDWLFPDFQVNGVAAAFFGPIIYALFNSLLAAILNIDRRQSYYAALVAQLARQRPDAVVSDKPGVVIVQIDGLARPILAHQMRAGRVPFMSRWIRSGEMKLDEWIALLPSQTSASQAGILHGNNSFIPAFRWWEKDSQRMMVSNHPEDAAEIVRRASNGEGLLSNDGASVGNLVSGDAVRSYITMATIRDPKQGLGQSRAWYSFFVSPDNYLRAFVLTVTEIVKEYWQATRSRRRGIEPEMHRGMPYPIARAATNVILRELSTALVMEEINRGTPVVYVDYTDYDEIAHHSGPERSETLDSLDGVDATLAALVKAAKNAPRPYRFVVLSDHGQTLGATFKQRYGESLEDVISGLMGGATDVAAATGRVEEWGPLNAVATEASHASGTTGALTRAAFGGRAEGGSIDLAPKKESRVSKGADSEPGLPPELVVCASGNLALIYFPRLPGHASAEEIERSWPGLIASLVAHPGVGVLMTRSETSGTIAIGDEGVYKLADNTFSGHDPLRPYGEFAAPGLRRVDGMDNAPDLLAISLIDEGTGEVAAFEELIGSHGGLGGPQTQPFILHPSEWEISQPIVGAEAVYRQLREWLSDIGIELGPDGSGATTGQPAAEETSQTVAASAPNG